MRQTSALRLGAAGVLLATLLGAFFARPPATHAVLGWSLTASPTTLKADRETDVTFKLTDTGLLGDIGCLRLEVQEALDVRDARITRKSVSGAWAINTSGGGLFETVEVFAETSSAKLGEDDWIEFVVTLRPRVVGLYTATGNVYSDIDCDGLTLYLPIPLTFVVEPGLATPTPTPTPRPTPTPTPRPTPTPTPRPTPTPTPRPTPTPTPRPTPTPTPRPTPTPTPRPTPTPTPRPTPTPTPRPTPTPTPRPPTPTPSPTPRPPTPTPSPTRPATASPTPSPTASPPATSTPTPGVTAGPSSAPSATPPVVGPTPGGSPPPGGPTAPPSTGTPVPSPDPSATQSPGVGDTPTPTETSVPTPSSTTDPGVVVPVPSVEPGPEGPSDLRYEIPNVLYPSRASEPEVDVSLDQLVRMDSSATWFIPALVTGVPGLLLILLVLGNVLLGVSWLPNVGRLLGPEPDEPDDDEHLWWAAGRPLS